MNPILIKVLQVVAVLAICAAVVFGIVRGYEAWRGHVFALGDTAGAARVQALWSTDTIMLAAVATAAISKARTDERNDAAKAMEVERETRRNAEKSALLATAAAARSDRAARGLLGDVAALNAAAGDRGLPQAASCAGELVTERNAAIAARALLGSCSTEYRQLGQDADAERDALELRLSTAMSYIQIVGPPNP